MERTWDLYFQQHPGRVIGRNAEIDAAGAEAVLRVLVVRASFPTPPGGSDATSTSATSRRRSADCEPCLTAAAGGLGHSFPNPPPPMGEVGFRLRLYRRPAPFP